MANINGKEVLFSPTVHIEGDIDEAFDEGYAAGYSKGKSEGGGDAGEFATKEELAAVESGLSNYIVGQIISFEERADTKYVLKEELDGTETGGYADVTIADITLDEDAASVKITSETFADISKVRDLIITFAIAKPIESNTAENPLYVKFNAVTAAVIGKQASGWAHNSYILNGTVTSFCIGTNRMCIAPMVFGANNIITYDLNTVKNLLPATLNSIEIVPANPQGLSITKGSVIKIEGRVAK